MSRRALRRNAAAGDSVPPNLSPIDFRWHDPPSENGQSIRMGRWDAGEQTATPAARMGGEDPKSHEDVRQWYDVNYAGGSDYSGGSVHESNRRVLEQMLAEHHPAGSEPAVWASAYGGHGSYGILVVWDQLDPEIQEILSALEEYGLISDEDHSELELEQQGEAWENWARSEFEKEFLEEWNARWSDDPEVEDWPEGADSYLLFEAAREIANVYWEDQSGGGQYIDLKRVVKTAVELLAGDRAVPSWMGADQVAQLVELGVALGMESTSSRPGARQSR